jgi:WS/DGAT/MGAT family acyltransferase
MGVEESPYLSQNDAIMWMVEADPLLRSTIIGVTLLESAPDWPQLVERVERVTRYVPALREKVVQPPLHPTTLRWVVDADFDLSYHLRHVRLPLPGTVQDLLDLVRTNAANGFDRERPLWEFTLVEGLEGGRAAFCMKAHHVLTDGIGSVQLAAYLFDFDPDHGDDADAAPPPPPVTDGSPAALLREVIEHDVEGAVDFARRRMRSVVPELLHAIRHPQQTMVETIETAMSIGRTVAPTFSRKSPVMTERRMSSNYRPFDVPVATLRAASKAVGGSLNDGFMAGITGGLRRYHERHGAEVDELRVAMPISLRADGDPVGGNHVTVMRFVVPVGLPDPEARIHALHDVVGRIRDERSLAHTETIAGVLNLMPRGVIGAMLKRVDFLASNVPGVPVPMYLLGKRVERFYPFGPTAGSSVNITLMSYDGTCCMGVNMDAAAIPDPDIFVECLREGFDEVLTLASAGDAAHPHRRNGVA